MKLLNYLLLIIFFFTTSSCFSATKKTVENANVVIINAQDIQTAPANTAVETSAAQTADAPDALIKDLYKTHDRDNGAIVQGKNRKILDKYFDKNLAGLIWKDMTTNRGEVGVIDFDIFYNTQDPDIKNLNVGAAKINGDKATVPATFTNYNTKYSVTYSLVKENSAWKISDIGYDKGESLLKYFKEEAKNDSGSDSKNASETGEFEGAYQVGETTCTVKPVKMAFEVKWAKGTGTEIFFFEERDDGKYAFASDSSKGKANAFVFDDENYNSGTFYRADGKEFPVKRIR